MIREKKEKKKEWRNGANSVFWSLFALDIDHNLRDDDDIYDNIHDDSDIDHNLFADDDIDDILDDGDKSIDDQIIERQVEALIFVTSTKEHQKNRK